MKELEFSDEASKLLFECIKDAKAKGIVLSPSSPDATLNGNEQSHISMDQDTHKNLIEEKDTEDSLRIPLAKLSSSDLLQYMQQCNLGEVIPIFEAIEMDGAMLSQVSFFTTECMCLPACINLR